MKPRKVLGAMLCVACAGGAHAGDVRSTAEASMLVTGHVQVGVDGSVKGYTLDKPEKLPAPVVDLLAKNVPQWHFTFPANLAPPTAPIDAHMSVRVRAKSVGGDNFNVNIEGASFDDGGVDKSERVSMKTRTPPRYPADALNAHVSGTVYLLMRVGRDGNVADVIAEQVNLEQYGSTGEMNHYRKALGDAALDAARSWTYNLPTKGSQVDAPYRVVRVPVQFNLATRGGSRDFHPYGSWHAYIPGPRERAPWADDRSLSGAPDAVPDGALRTVDSGMRLATPLGDG